MKDKTIAESHLVRPFYRRGKVIVASSMVGLAGLSVVAFSVGRGTDKPTEPDAAHPVLTVAIVTPERVTWPDKIVAQGAIAPSEEASIGTQIGSYQLVDVRANVGDQVRRGQVLARLNPALLKAEEAQLQARHEQAQANDRRAQGLKMVGGISEQEALQFATEAKSAAALLAAKRLELRYTAIVAPDDGAITARAATLGAVVPAGQELFRMIRRNRLEWRGELTPSQLNAARAGRSVTLRLPDGSTASATVRQFAPSLDARSGLGTLYADLAPGSRARAGIYATGEISVGASPALIVPADCIMVRDGRNLAMAVTGTGPIRKVVRRVVTVGRRANEKVEIRHGLSGMEQLVLRGASFLDDGDVVRVERAVDVQR